jgi:hypothetical protein
MVAPQSLRAGALRGVELAAKEVGVARMQQPAALLLHRHANGPGMSGERHHENLGRYADQLGHAVEAHQAPAIGVMAPPDDVEIPLLRASTGCGAMKPRRPVLAAIHSLSSTCTVACGKSSMPPLIEVETGHNDVPHSSAP